MADAHSTTNNTRRHLLRTIGGVTVGVAAATIPAAIIETASDRLERHLAGLQDALREVYPELAKIEVFRPEDSTLRFMITAFQKAV